MAGNTLYNSNFKKITASREIDSIKTRQDVDRMLLIVAESQNSFTFDSLFDHSPFATTALKRQIEVKI